MCSIRADSGFDSHRYRLVEFVGSWTLAHLVNSIKGDCRTLEAPSAVRTPIGGAVQRLLPGVDLIIDLAILGAR
jgi:hypothetical protein